MIMNNKQNFLAIVNDLTQERYIDRVNEEGKREYTPEEENARLRKAVYLLLTCVVKNHPEIVDDPAYKEAVEYYNRYESIKQTIKEDLSINTEGDTTP